MNNFTQTGFLQNLKAGDGFVTFTFAYANSKKTKDEKTTEYTYLNCIMSSKNPADIFFEDQIPYRIEGFLYVDKKEKDGKVFTNVRVKVSCIGRMVYYASSKKRI